MIRFGIACIALAALAGCSTPVEDAARAQESAYEAQAKVAEERLRLIERYQECVKEAEADTSKAAACDSYLRAAEALK